MSGIENIKIEELKEKDKNPGEKLNKDKLDQYFNEDFFSDLENENIKIKKQWNLYIFEQKDKNGNRIDDDWNRIEKFCVKEAVFREYLKAEKEKEENTLESDTLLNKFLTKMYTQQELGDLENNINSGSNNGLETGNESNEVSPEKLITEIDKLIDWFQENRRWPRAPKAADNRYSKVRFEQVIKDDLASLKSIKRELKNYEYTTNIDRFVEEVDILNWHKEKLEEVRQMIALWKNTADIPSILNSIWDVKKEALFQEIASKYNMEYNKLLKNATLSKLWNKDAEWLQKYLKDVWSWDIEHPSQHPFYEAHKKDFEYIMSKDIWLYYDITSKKTEVAGGSYNNTGGRSPEYSRWSKVERWNLFSDMLVKMWIIDENDKKKQAAWAKFGKVWMLALWAFAIYKIFTTKGKWRRGWIAGTLGGILALNNTDKIQSWFKDAFGKSNAGAETIAEVANTNKETAQENIVPQANTLRCIGGIPINTLISMWMIEEKWWKMQINKTKYENYISTHPTMEKDEKDYHMNAMKSVVNDPEALNKSLAYMWINNIKEFEDLAEDNTTILLETQNVSEYYDKIQSPINAELEKEWLKPSSPEAWYKITKEYENGEPSNTQIAKWIKEGLIEVKDTDLYKIEDIINTSWIDLQNKTIEWLTNNTWMIKFETYEELFNTINLTNFIKENFANKKAKSESPFHLKVWNIWSIEFDNTERYQIWKNETKVINDWLFNRTLKDLSETLQENKEDYVAYLNEWRNSVGTVEN